MSHLIKFQSTPARVNWQQRVEESGLLWHADQGEPYWSEQLHLQMSLQTAEVLESAANELHAMALQACEAIVSNQWWSRLAIPEHVVPMVIESWQQRDPSLYGRFDMAWDGSGTPKLLEYNADTPTSLLEAAVTQWQWLEDVAVDDDQLNSLHEALVEQWSQIPESCIHFACAWDAIEDRQTIAYLAETAEQAGKKVVLMDISEVGFNEAGRFTDVDETEIDKLFKLYPWEWMMREEFGQFVADQRQRLLEPAWKMMLSNKGLLAILWEMFPDHPNLLPAYTDLTSLQKLGVKDWVEKPFFGREGGGVKIYQQGELLTSNPEQELGGPRLYQAKANLLQGEGMHVVFGLWMVGNECRALSARADQSLITGNFSKFLPHRLV